MIAALKNRVIADDLPGREKCLDNNYLQITRLERK
jgi:hypothetical protein